MLLHLNKTKNKVGGATYFEEKKEEKLLWPQLGIEPGS
jgi:hypothetical protein